ncbi:hypothetical protein NQ317_007316 [Molorchus minor]|uniref:Tyr recombinase domain-containing protein n=1 Tax=Molorchus minor TaxID=1323400 RepID=A0ABQ9J814_9CUCU|nr:hypothetical protein NQ317_007316 [Molorchus minor]
MWEICLNCFENTCPFVLPTSSISAFFLYYKAGKCSSQPVGKNTMGKIPSVVASYLKLPDVACYTGHCLRRSSATLLADAGVDITTIKRHAGWKSTTVAEGYVENSIENKTKIANQVLVGTTTSAITKTVNVSESNIPSNINFENCTNVGPQVVLAQGPTNSRFAPILSTKEYLNARQLFGFEASQMLPYRFMG